MLAVGAFLIGLYLYAAAAMYLISSSTDPEEVRLSPSSSLPAALGPWLVGCCAMALAVRLRGQRSEAGYRFGLIGTTLWLAAIFLRTRA